MFGGGDRWARLSWEGFESVTGVLWLLTSGDERCLDFPEKFFRYACEDRGVVVRFLVGCVVEKGLNWSDLGGEVAMEVLETG